MRTSRVTPPHFSQGGPARSGWCVLTFSMLRIMRHFGEMIFNAAPVPFRVLNTGRLLVRFHHIWFRRFNAVNYRYALEKVHEDSAYLATCETQCVDWIAVRRLSKRDLFGRRFSIPTEVRRDARAF
jgi:hypothetical protein